MTSTYDSTTMGLDWQDIVRQIVSVEGKPVNPTRLRNKIAKADFGVDLTYHTIYKNTDKALCQLIQTGEIGAFQSDKGMHKLYGFLQNAPYHQYNHVPPSPYIMRHAKESK